jgi:hypothetical protein
VSAVSSRDAINATGYNTAINQKRWKLGEEIFINWNKKPKTYGKMKNKHAKKLSIFTTQKQR